MKKVFLVLILLILCFSLVSAENLVKEYSKTQTLSMSADIKEGFNSEYGVITIKDIAGTTEVKKAEYSLIKNTPYCIVNCEAEGKVVLYDEAVIFDSVEYKTLQGFDTDIFSSQIQLFVGYEDNFVSVPDKYKEICSNVDVVDNKTLETSKVEVCEQVVDTYKIVNQPIEKWSNYDSKPLAAGSYRWKIKGVKLPSQSVDFVPLFKSLSFSEWATWTASFNTGLVAYWDFNETSGIAVDKITGRFNFTDNSMGTSGGIINNSRGKGSGTASMSSNWANTMVGTSDFAINFWVYRTSNADYSKIISSCASQANCPDRGFDLVEKTGGPSYYMRAFNQAGTEVISNVTNAVSIPNGWVMYSIVKNSTDNIVYINGSVGMWTKLSGTFDIINRSLIKIGNEVGFAGADGKIGPFYYDEMGLWNRTLSQAEITDLYNAGLGLTYFGGPFTEMTATASIPVNYFNTTNRNVTLGVNCSGVGGENVTSVRFSLSNGTNFTISSINSASYNATISKLYADGTYNWTSTCFGSSGVNASTISRLFTLDSTPPSVNSLTNGVIYYLASFPSNITFNMTSFNAASCWYNLNGTNVSYICVNTTSISIPTAGIYTLSYYANDTWGNLYSNSSSFSTSCEDGYYLQQNGVCNPLGGQSSFNKYLNTSVNPLASSTGFFAKVGDLFKQDPWAFSIIACIILFFFFTAGSHNRK